MKKQISRPIYHCLLALLVSSLVFAGCTSTKQVVPEAMLASPSSEPSQLTTSVPDSLDAAQYTIYSSEALANAADGRRVLFFFANWCPTCAAAQKDLQENISALPSGLTIFRVNYNDPDTDEQEKALAKQYGITYQHTFVQIDENGAAVAKWNGGDSQELLKNIQ